MKVSEIMQTELRDISIDKDRMISDALDIMNKYKSSVLIVTNRGKLVGIVTEHDIADRLGSSRAGKLKASSLHVSSVMESVKPISPESDVEYAAQKMYEVKLNGIPIVKDDKLVGLVTYNELTKLCEKVKTIPVEKIMSKYPKTISPEDRLVHARNEMFEKNISVLPVIDPNGRIMGILSIGMIARAFAEFRESVPAKHQEERLRYILVGDVMEAEPPTIKQNEEIGEAASLMLSEGLRGIPILDEKDTFTGIVTKTDMIALVKNQFQVD
ncbi:MAG: CBS domain-containing protein [Candidatus Lokiarchaeota archaeon]|nr:CBS domain-containing protein [Candidatus Lokiarchaeota archaeon]